MADVLQPYLLGTVENCLNICWEGQADRPYAVSVRQTARQQGERHYSPSFKTHVSDQTGIYSAAVTGLEDGADYQYRIKDGETEVYAGTIRQPKCAPGEAKYLVMSDSHAFNLRQQMCEVAQPGKYRAVLNIGDLPSGTGYQREQYLSGWFDAFAEPLAAVPMVYAPGNHDDGPHFDTYFGWQANFLNRTSTGRCFSFTDAANTHFVFLDSNPWGLSQMNAVNSGVPIPAETEQTIAEIKQWLTEDLQSEAARNATWTVVILHHPYTDEFTNEHLVPIVEEMGVDLVLSGHLHKYHKTVPIAGGVAPRPLYVTVPSCQDAAHQMRRSDGEQRLMGAFPEVVAEGNGNYLDLDITPARMTLTVYGWGEEGGFTVVDRTILDKAEQSEKDLHFTGHRVKIDTSNQVAMCSAEVTNKGAGLRLLMADIIDNGEIQTLRFTNKDASGSYQYLEAGETKHVTFHYPVAGAGEHVVQFGEEQCSIVLPGEVGLVCDDASLSLNRDASVLQVNVQVTNQDAQEEAAGTLEIMWDGQSVAQYAVGAPACGTLSQTFTYQYARGGKHQVQVRLCGRVIVEENLDCGGGIAIIPTVQDRSIWGNHALVRGNPRLLVQDGNPWLHFEDDADYLEIPASDSMRAPEGYTALVRAQIDRLAYSYEMAHNPLLVRGNSVGWGATYFARMVIDRNGTMKWGTCYGPTEYGWAGGKVRLESPANYEMQFTKAAGGICKIDGEVVASVPPIGADEKLNEYSQMPTFIGYSYIGHVIEEIGRPMYYTHLPAAVGAVVFAEGAADLGGLAGSGDLPSNIKAYLDFGSITAQGGYTSQWRAFRNYAKQFLRDVDVWTSATVTVDAEIPPGCEGVLRVASSVDAKQAAALQEVQLRDGRHQYLLDEAICGQYVQFSLQLRGKVTVGEQILSPKVSEVEVAGTNGSLRAQVTWSTQQQWRDGVFTGDLGIEPLDRLRVFDQYTDPIHG